MFSWWSCSSFPLSLCERMLLFDHVEVATARVENPLLGYFPRGKVLTDSVIIPVTYYIRFCYFGGHYFTPLTNECINTSLALALRAAANAGCVARSISFWRFKSATARWGARVRAAGAARQPRCCAPRRSNHGAPLGRSLHTPRDPAR